MSTGLKRTGNENFYTKKEIAQNCCDIINSKNIIKKSELIIEPSAGNGSFIEFIKSLSDKYIFYDIDPKHNEILNQDFLKINLKTFETKIHIIGNPPFGRQSSLAKKFIKNCYLAETISFILPKSFKKESFQKTFPLNFHLIHENDLPKNSFMVDEKEYDVPCVFQIWKKEKYEREILKIETPKNFKFVKKEDDHDISFRRVGINAGEINTNTKDKSSSSHYFIKFTKSYSLEKLKKIPFSSDNTVGPRSISKPELIRAFNKIM